MDILMRSSNLIKSLEKNTKQFREGMKKAGFTISGDNHPISPVMLGDAKIASAMASQMLDHGIYVIAFSFPVVPKGKARIRVQLSAAHTEEEIDRAIKAFTDVGKKLKIISWFLSIYFSNYLNQLTFQIKTQYFQLTHNLFS